MERSLDSISRKLRNLRYKWLKDPQTPYRDLIPVIGSVMGVQYLKYQLIERGKEKAAKVSSVGESTLSDS